MTPQSSSHFYKSSVLRQFNPSYNSFIVTRFNFFLPFTFKFLKWSLVFKFSEKYLGAVFMCHLSHPSWFVETGRGAHVTFHAIITATFLGRKATGREAELPPPAPSPHPSAPWSCYTPTTLFVYKREATFCLQTLKWVNSYLLNFLSPCVIPCNTFPNTIPSTLFSNIPLL